eukprot:2386658-Amphidinium_carterae.1
MEPVSARRLLRLVTVACCLTASTASSTGAGSAMLLRVSKFEKATGHAQPRGTKEARKGREIFFCQHVSCASKGSSNAS